MTTIPDATQSSDDQYESYTPPNKFTKLSEPGQSVAGTVVSIDHGGKYGPEVLLTLDGGGQTTLTCSSAQLRAWAENAAAAGDFWRITLLRKGPGDKGKKEFTFQRRRPLPF